MTRYLFLLQLPLLIGLISGCAVLDRQGTNRQIANAGLDAAISQLPSSSKFVTIRVFKFEFPKDDLFRESFIARGYEVLGFSISEKEAVNFYFEAVQKLGWIPRPDQYETTKVLRRGNNEVMVVGVTYEASDIKGAIDWSALQRKYPSVVIVSIDYHVPGRDQ